MPAPSTLKRQAASPANATPRPLLTEAEAAKHLKCSISFLRDDRRGLRLVPFLKIGALVRYRVADVEKALDRMVMGVKR